MRIALKFKRNKVDVSATVERLEYDPKRTAFIAPIKYQDELAYILGRTQTAPTTSLKPFRIFFVRDATGVHLMPVAGE